MQERPRKTGLLTQIAKILTLFTVFSQREKRLLGIGVWASKGRETIQVVMKEQIFGKQNVCLKKQDKEQALLQIIQSVKRVKVLVAQSCPTPFDPMDCTPGSSVHGILQARILEWVAIPFSRESSQPESPALQADSSPTKPPGKQLRRVEEIFFSPTDRKHF